MTQPNKTLGQHWLHDEASLQAMCDYAEVNAEDLILEVGPGLGTLTRYLLEAASHVVAVEYDERLLADLRVSYPELELIHGDIRTFDVSKLPANYKVVANIPYYLTSVLVRRLLEASNQPQRIVLLVQKEVAERMAAAPGQMSVLGVMCQFYGDVRLGDVIPAALFEPPPEVDSQIVILDPHQTPPQVDTKRFFRLVKAGFGERRKKLSNSLSGGLHISKPEIEASLEQADIAIGARAQELSVDDWLRLFAIIDAKMTMNR